MAKSNKNGGITTVFQAIVCLLVMFILTGLVLQVALPSGKRPSDWFDRDTRCGTYFIVEKNSKNKWEANDEVKLEIKHDGTFVLYEKDGGKVTTSKGTWKEDSKTDFVVATLPEFDEEGEDYVMYILFGDDRELYVYEDKSDEAFSMCFLKEKAELTKSITKALDDNVATSDDEG